MRSEQKFFSFMTFCAYEVVCVVCQSRMGREKRKRDEHSAAQDAFSLCQISLGFGLDFVTQRINKGIKSGFLSFIAGFQDPEAFCYSNPQAKSVHTVAATTANVCLR